jgi:hypothetical protein
MIMRGSAAEALQNNAPEFAVEGTGIQLHGAAEGMVVLDLSLQPVALDGGGEAILNQLNGGRGDKISACQLPRDLLE